MLRRDTLSRQRDNIVLGVLIVFCLVSLSISSREFLVNPKEFGLSLFSFFQRGISGVSTFFNETVNSIRELSELKQEYAESLDKLKYYERIEKDYASLERENQALRQLLSFSESLGFENLPAQVIAKDPENVNTTIIINKGRLEGVERNMPVVAIQGGQQGLVGKVVETGLNTAMIQPLYDRNAYVAGRLLTSRYEGLVGGKGTVEPVLVMRYVKKLAKSDIQYGDMVITSGMNSIFPIGIYVGTVKSILSRNYESSLELEIEPVVDFARLEYVFVLLIKS